MTTATKKLTTNCHIDAEEVRRALELLAPPVFELRALNCKAKGEWRTGTFSGYFQRDAIDDAIAALEDIEFASGVYITPNVINPDLLARSFNRARIITREPTTADKDVIARSWLLIDCDPVRVANVSSTDEEKAAATEMVNAIDCQLWERGFPPGLITDSGNGAHLMIPVELPADDGGFCERILKGLARDFNSAAVKVDETTFNPSRIWKLPGTLACKGDDVPEIGRPWRMAKIVQICMEVPSDA